MSAIWLATLLAAQPAPSPACVQAASEQHSRKNYLLAARLAEECWDRTRHVHALLVGCQARVSLGHFAHAARALALYDVHAATDPSTWSRDSARALHTTIAEHTGSLHITLTPPLTANERFRFELVPLDATARESLGGGIPELERTSTPGLALDAGHWSLIIHREDFEPTRDELRVSLRTAQTVTVDMRRLATPSAVQLATRPTRLLLGPARALRSGIELHLRLLDTGAEIVRTQFDEALTFYLPPGRWQLLARARGYAPRQIVVRPGAPLNLQLHRKSP